MNTIQSLSVSALKEAIMIKEQIESLGSRLSALFSGEPSTGNRPGPKQGAKKQGRRTMSASARAKIAEAQRARWAKSKGTAASAVKAAPKAVKAAKPAKKGRKRSGLTPEGRAKLASAMKARWAARRKGAPAPNAS